MYRTPETPYILPQIAQAIIEAATLGQDDPKQPEDPTLVELCDAMVERIIENCKLEIGN